MINVTLEIEQDCSIIIDRVFRGRSLTFFGEDGNGRHGRSTFPVTAKVAATSTSIESFSDDYSEIEAYTALVLDGYDARVTGHAITDQNLRISLNLLLQACSVDPDALDWGPLNLQDDHTIVLKVNAKKLLSW